ncbi:coiled-coil and C2 domain-containing protein 1A isoform X1 [Sinocyclocheilus rhinocerous]|uniref:coiled-coil and C2 domain-containing protein 1A isoform X1 n=1 Tax=Sinocyclocheilus rhinocerous TaxID=307959 RepID=UPI0007B7A6D6|nr:PREDICTED: coiled-coil and C2 domain-containing protein 1A-like isoform X1 [Sinocyclocheilus rhinocerous]XP_016417063.1 PREDICTED: coiled-coil and C2 domain-containing protein 1A-like isoform X1 [Sinocyclocheilus rhinocerous]
MSRSRNPPQKGQGAARAKQMGLLLDLAPDSGLDDSGGNDEELEAELLALMGGGGGSGPAGKRPGGKAPVPMEDIERMAAFCMKDLDEDVDDDGDLENDADLLAELSEVLEDDKEQVVRKPPPSPVPPQRSNAAPASQNAPASLEACLQERLDMYQTAITNAKAAGETSKARRYDRGLKTLQSMLMSVKKGKPINEDEIPPAVATGGKPSAASQAEPITEQEKPAPANTPPQTANVKPVAPSKPQLLQPTAVTPDTPAISPLTPGQPNTQHSELKASILSRQREYKLAALKAKQSGNTEQAKQLYQMFKGLDSVVESVDRREFVDISSLPPPPGEVEVPRSNPPQLSSKAAAPPAASTAAPDTALSAPRSVAEALQQRMDKYREAAESAKSKGDDRKARMHQRIVKQYQDAIKSHKAGRPVNLAELPVPPGCPPLQGTEGGEQNFMGVLETAMKLANQDADADADEEPQKPSAQPAVQKSRAPAPPKASSAGSTNTPKLGGKAQQQLDFLTMRRQQFVKAALRSKEMKDMQGAAQHLRNAKGLDAMITAAKAGLPVDITKVPAAPVSEDNYRLSHSRSSALSPRASEQYTQLMAQLKQQHEKCLAYSQQFTHMGNVAETARFEKLAEECMSNIEVLKKAHAKGRSVPKFHTEERTFNTVKIFPTLMSNDMVLTVVKGINLPAPPGVSANDLDASVRFEFPFPSAEEAQRDKTSTVRNTNCPEFKEQFKLNIKRDHRGFKRVVQAKGIKFEVVHKGGLFKTDKVVGSAQLKLEALENQCEIREIIDVLDGRKATGGKLEVRVKIREPLSGVQLQPVTEKWLVIDPLTPSPEKDREREKDRDREKSREKERQAPPPRSKPGNDHDRNSKPSSSPPQYKLHSFSLLQHDKERLEWKINDYKKNRREPSELIKQHMDVCQRLQWQKSYLEKHPAALTEYENVLRKFVHGLSDSVKMFSSQGNRDAAKDALGRLKMVENELESVRKKRAIRE